ncbi:MAG: putative peptidase family protein, partial [Frankiales bacterium]|nr:putative peptidase family protein [Frankiales bacterium]
MRLGSRTFAGLTAGTAAAALILAPSILPGSVAQASSLAGHHVGGLAPLQLKAATHLGDAPSGALQKVTIVLSLRDKAGLSRLLNAQVTPGTADFHRWLTPAQFAARFSPTAASVRAATSFASAHGLKVVSVSSNRTLVQVSGTTAAINHAFGIVEQKVQAAGQTFLTPNRAATLPASLRDVTASVLGLTTFNANHLQHVVRGTSTATATTCATRNVP